MTAPLYVTLLHSPVINRRGEQVVSAVTNLDIHDIARSSCTYGAKKYFIVTPIRDQHDLVGRILGHWQKERSKVGHPDRYRALQLVELAWDFAEVKRKISEECGGEEPEVVLTDARELSPNGLSPESYAAFRARWEQERATRTRPLNVVLGTAWGAHDSFFPEVHRILAPVYGPEGNAKGAYNHLSVRAAAGIILDRLFGT